MKIKWPEWEVEDNYLRSTKWPSFLFGFTGDLEEMINHLRVLLPHNKVVLHFGEQTIIFIKRQERKYQELNRKYHDMKAANHMLEVSIATYLYNWTIILSINKKYSVIRASWKIKLINGIWLSFFFQIHYLLVGLKFNPRFFVFFFFFKQFYLLRCLVKYLQSS